jgi:thiol-disulfide isomerase/thioredoxin
LKRLNIEATNNENWFFSKVDSTFKAIVMSNKDTWWGPFLMIDMYNYLDEQAAPLYQALSQEAKDSYYGRMVKDEIYPKDLTGQAVPALNIKDGTKTISFKDLTKDKKYIIIDFWASWCVPCRKEIPNLKKLYALYANKGLQIVSISIDKDAAAWKKAFNEEKMAWPSYLDTTGIADLYKVKLIPTMFLVDNKGILISDKLRGETLANKLAELFK